MRGQFFSNYCRGIDRSADLSTDPSSEVFSRDTSESLVTSWLKVYLPGVAQGITQNKTSLVHQNLH